MGKWIKSYTDLYFLDQDLKAANTFMQGKLERQKLQLRVKALEKIERKRQLTESELTELVALRKELL